MSSLSADELERVLCGVEAKVEPTSRLLYHYTDTDSAVAILEVCFDMCLDMCADMRLDIAVLRGLRSLRAARDEHRATRS